MKAAEEVSHQQLPASSQDQIPKVSQLRDLRISSFRTALRLTNINHQPSLITTAIFVR